MHVKLTDLFKTYIAVVLLPSVHNKLKHLICFIEHYTKGFKKNQCMMFLYTCIQFVTPEIISAYLYSPNTLSPEMDQGYSN